MNKNRKIWWKCFCGGGKAQSKNKTQWTNIAPLRRVATVAYVDPVDILFLKVTNDIERLKQLKKRLKEYVKENQKKLEKFISEKKQKKAIRALYRKKELSSLIDICDESIIKIEKLHSSIQLAKMQTQVMDTIKTGTAALKEAQSKYDISDVEMILLQAEEAYEETLKRQMALEKPCDDAVFKNTELQEEVKELEKQLSQSQTSQATDADQNKTKGSLTLKPADMVIDKPMTQTIPIAVT